MSAAALLVLNFMEKKIQNYVTKEMSERIKTEKEEGNEREERKTKLQNNFLKTHCTNQTFM